MATHFSYLNFCSTTIILVKNKKDITETLSIIFQFSSQNHGHLGKKSLCLNSCSLFPSESHVQKLQKLTSLNNFFPKSFTTHLETSHGTLECCNIPVGSHCPRRNCLLILSLTSLENKITDKMAIDLFHSHLEITINEKDLDCLYI